jgi:hypothetical protein
MPRGFEVRGAGIMREAVDLFSNFHITESAQLKRLVVKIPCVNPNLPDRVIAKYIAQGMEQKLSDSLSLRGAEK